MKEIRRFVIIGTRMDNTFCINLGRVLQADGHRVVFYDPINLMLRYCLKLKKGEMTLSPALFLKKYAISLKRCFEEKLLEQTDYVIISQKDVKFLNDVEIPVIYYHHELALPPSVSYPNAILVSYPEGTEFYERYFSREWYSTEDRYMFPAAVLPEMFTLRKKTIKGLSVIGYPQGDKGKIMEKEYKSFIEDDLLSPVRDMIRFAEKNLDTFNVFNYGVPGEEFRALMEKIEALVIITNHNFYITRRMFEAAVCRTLIVLHVENDRAAKFYEKLELVDGENCIMFRDRHSLCRIADELNHGKIDYKDILVNAEKWALSAHTYQHRVKLLYRIIKSIEGTPWEEPEDLGIVVV